MKKFVLALVIITLFAFVLPIKNVKILMAGDSTMTIQPRSKQIFDSIMGKIIDEPFPVRGWGQMLPDFFSKNVTIQNFAESGKSTKSFMTAGLWTRLLANLDSGEYVVIEFGHNDELNNLDRHTSPEEYEANLLKFISDVKGKGGIPILCTPVASRKFINHKLVMTLQPYSNIVRKIAKEKNILFIDMEKKGAEIIKKYGEKGSEKLFVTLNPGENKNFPNGVKEKTHFNELGATLMANAFIQGLKELKLDDLTCHLKKNN